MKDDKQCVTASSMKYQWEQYGSYSEAVKDISERMKISNSEARSVILSLMPKESWYQSRVLKAIGDEYPQAFVWKAAAGVYGRQGIPDICAIISGKFFGFEIKRPLIGKETGIQSVTISKIKEAGGVAKIVHTPEEAFEIISNTLCRRY